MNIKGEKQSLQEILKAKDERVFFQNYLLEIHKKNIIAFKLNIPGPIKYNDYIRKIFDEGLKVIKEALDEAGIEIICKRTFYKNTGPEQFIVIDKNPYKLKKLCALIEETHPLGRLYDFDVLDEKGMQISRTDINKEPRSCLICNNNAFECGRSRRHSLEDLLGKIEELVKTYFA